MPSEGYLYDIRFLFASESRNLLRREVREILAGVYLVAFSPHVSVSVKILRIGHGNSTEAKQLSESASRPEKTLLKLNLLLKFTRVHECTSSSYCR